MTLELRATPEDVMRAVEALQDFARAQQVPEEAIFGLALALEESGSNIVNHACQHNAHQKFQVLFERDRDSFIIELRDPGPAFDPTQVRTPPPQANDCDLPGGWGIELVRRYMDGICYQRKGKTNVLRLTRRLGPATGKLDSLSSKRKPEKQKTKTKQ
jgi:serine/threonine-protein kinase RsbW